MLTKFSVSHSGFIQYLHYAQEKVDRRMFTLRTQLKISYRAQQKAQISEKKANASKRRFISYIFHEVRVVSCQIPNIVWSFQD